MNAQQINPVSWQTYFVYQQLQLQQAKFIQMQQQYQSQLYQHMLNQERTIQPKKQAALNQIINKAAQKTIQTIPFNMDLLNNRELPEINDSNGDSFKNPSVQGTVTNDSVMAKNDQKSIDSEIMIKKEYVPIKVEYEENELGTLLNSIIDNVGFNDGYLQAQLEKIDSPSVLRDIFVLLLEKYQTRQLSKEEYTKYIIRKVFKYIQKQIKVNQTNYNGKKLTSKQVHELCLRSCFDEEEIQKQMNILPFRKNSKIRTMNSSFIMKVFASPKFVAYYDEFLESFDQILDQDQNVKIENLIENIQNLQLHGDLIQIKKLKRLPWSNKTLQQLKRIAQNLRSQY